MHTRAWYGVVPRLLPDFDVVSTTTSGRASPPRTSRTRSPFRRVPAEVLDVLAIPRSTPGDLVRGVRGPDFARLFPERLHTLTLSGILLPREELFSMYQELSLRFYPGGPEVFELYTHYMYEKIFGEAFVVAMKANLPVLRPGSTTATRTRHTPSSASPSRRTRSSRLSTRTSRATRRSRARSSSSPAPRTGRSRRGCSGSSWRLPRRALGADRGLRPRRLPREARRLLRDAPQVPGGEVDDVLRGRDSGAPLGRPRRAIGPGGRVAARAAASTEERSMPRRRILAMSWTAAFEACRTGRGPGREARRRSTGGRSGSRA